jgi:hypothetical protein
MFDVRPHTQHTHISVTSSYPHRAGKIFLYPLTFLGTVRQSLSTQVSAGKTCYHLQHCEFLFSEVYEDIDDCLIRATLKIVIP